MTANLKRPIAPLREGTPLQGLKPKNVFTRLWETYFGEVNDGIYQTSSQVNSHVNDFNNPHKTSDQNLIFTDNTVNNVSTAKHGFAPKAPGDSTKFLNGLGSWAAPELHHLGDVNITSPAQSDTLAYDAASGKWVNIAALGFVADSVTLDVGTHGLGDAASTRVPFDNDYYEITEVTGVPGFDVTLNILGVTAFTRINAHVKYSGNANHRIQLRLYNNGSSGWDDVTAFTDMSDLYQWISVDGIPSAAYIHAGDGLVKVNFYHVSSGNNSHKFLIDYVALAKGQ